MPVALLAIFGGLTATQWVTLISLLPVVIKIIGVFSGVAAELFETVVADIRANMKETGKGHKAVTTKMITEGYAVPGWNNEETKAWLDRATPSQDSRDGSG
jgi:hypothetical protein